MDHLIPPEEIDRYASPPSDTTVTSVSSFQEAIRDLLGGDYDTFLQGSYRNFTAIRDINDVDVVALRKHTVSAAFSDEHYSSIVPWARIFDDVQQKIEGAERFRGKTIRADKCIEVRELWKADVVPAVRIGRYEDDPIAIYSFKAGAERKNYPRIHWSRGVSKNKATGETFRPMVRLFKNWVANHWPDDDAVAPSFYVESLIHNVPDVEFRPDLAWGMFLVGYWIEKNIRPDTPPVVWSVAHDKDILTESEWQITEYRRFHAQLVSSTTLLLQALQATTRESAVRHWRAAFNE